MRHRVRAELLLDDPPPFHPNLPFRGQDALAHHTDEQLFSLAVRFVSMAEDVVDILRRGHEKDPVAAERDPGSAAAGGGFTKKPQRIATEREEATDKRQPAKSGRGLRHHLGPRSNGSRYALASRRSWQPHFCLSTAISPLAWCISGMEKGTPL